MDTFDQLPISAVVNGQYLAMHGGISRRLTSLDAINQIDRFREVDEESLLADLLWADPAASKQSGRDYQFNMDR